MLIYLQGLRHLIQWLEEVAGEVFSFSLSRWFYFLRLVSSRRTLSDTWMSLIRRLKRRLSSTPDGRHFVPMRDFKHRDLSLADPEDVRKEKERFVILTS